MDYQIRFENGQQKGCLILTQWDRNVQLKISGLTPSENTEVHWGNKLLNEYLNVHPTIDDNLLYVSIPNILLQSPEDIIGYIYIDTTTFYRIDIQIQTRAKPQDVPTDPVLPYYPLGLSSIDIESLEAINSLAILALLGGGTLGQILKKKSNSDLDFEWQDIDFDAYTKAEVNNLLSGKADKVNVTPSDVGKFMRVNPQGQWGAEEVPNASGVNF